MGDMRQGSHTWHENESPSGEEHFPFLGMLEDGYVLRVRGYGPERIWGYIGGRQRGECAYTAAYECVGLPGVELGKQYLYGGGEFILMDDDARRPSAPVAPWLDDASREDRARYVPDTRPITHPDVFGSIKSIEPGQITLAITEDRKQFFAPAWRQLESWECRHITDLEFRQIKYMAESVIVRNLLDEERSSVFGGKYKPWAMSVRALKLTLLFSRRRGASNYKTPPLQGCSRHIDFIGVDAMSRALALYPRYAEEGEPDPLLCCYRDQSVVIGADVFSCDVVQRWMDDNDCLHGFVEMGKMFPVCQSQDGNWKLV